jgi:hypothetical protein
MLILSPAQILMLGNPAELLEREVTELPRKCTNNSLLKM